jgi:hypothetical protein
VTLPTLFLRGVSASRSLPASPDAALVEVRTAAAAPIGPGRSSRKGRNSAWLKLKPRRDARKQEREFSNL